MTVLCALLLSVLAFIYFSMSVTKHFKLIYPDAELGNKTRVSCHLIGWGLLLIALYMCIQCWQVEIGASVWVCMLQAGALTVSFCLTYQTRFYILAAQLLSLNRAISG